jgi:hypothetical protein
MGVLVTTGLLFYFEVTSPFVLIIVSATKRTVWGIQHTARKSVLRHWLGILKLFEYRGAESHVFEIEHLFFVELRYYWVRTVAQKLQIMEGFNDH